MFDYFKAHFQIRKFPFISPNLLLYLVFLESDYTHVYLALSNIKNQYYLSKVDNYFGTFKKGNIVILKINDVTRAIISL